MNPCTCTQTPNEQPGCPNECFFHGCEPTPAVFWRICGECGHCYHTFTEAQNEERRIIGDLNAKATREKWAGHETPMTLSLTMEDMFCCPMCSHDW